MNLRQFALRCACLLAAGCALGHASTRAGVTKVFSDTAKFQAQSLLPVGGAPLNETSLLAFSNSGRMFTNSAGTQSGSQVRSIGAVRLDSVRAGGTTHLGITGSQQGQLVAIFGLMGYRQDAPGAGANNVSHDASDGGFGRLRVVELPAGGVFSAGDIQSWGFDAPAVADYGIHPRSAVDSGQKIGIVGAESIDRPPHEVNMAGVNTAIGDTLGGLAVFFEDMPLGAGGLLDSDGFVRQLSEATLLTDELVILNHEQRAIQFDSQTLSAEDQFLLNAIADFAFDDVFAEFGSGTDEDFVAGNNAGDTAANLGADLLPAVLAEAITAPEPSAVAVWTLLAGVGLSLCKLLPGSNLRRCVQRH